MAIDASGTVGIVALTGNDILTPWAARGISETLTPIEQNIPPRRDINGVLRDLRFSAFDKYKLSLECTDFSAPALDGIWRGLTVVVSCASELRYRTSGGSPARTPVSGSSRTDGDFTYYRPQLTCRVVDFSQQYGEWTAEYAWRLELEEA